MENLAVDESLSLMLDGNALAGLLYELFEVEMTVAALECASCGREGEMGSLWLFSGGPGYVLRCPSCHNIVLRLAVTPAGVTVDARGAAYLCIPKR